MKMGSIIIRVLAISLLAVLLYGCAKSEDEFEEPSEPSSESSSQLPASDNQMKESEIITSQGSTPGRSPKGETEVGTADLFDGDWIIKNDVSGLPSETVLAFSLGQNNTIQGVSIDSGPYKVGGCWV